MPDKFAHHIELVARRFLLNLRAYVPPAFYPDEPFQWRVPAPASVTRRQTFRVRSSMMPTGHRLSRVSPIQPSRMTPISSFHDYRHTEFAADWQFRE